MPQELFDSLAITYLMCAGEIPDNQPMIDKCEGVLKHYVDGSYKGENYSSLRLELIEAAIIVKELVEKVLKELIGEVESPSRHNDYFDLLKALSRSIEADARKKRPFMRRVFGGSFLNYERSAPAGRIKQCRQDIGRAVAKDLVLEALSFQGTYGKV